MSLTERLIGMGPLPYSENIFLLLVSVIPTDEKILHKKHQQTYKQQQQHQNHNNQQHRRHTNVEGKLP